MSPRNTSNTEKFIGENLINKIGIAVTFIGIVLGAEYAIEQKMISPLSRLIYGFLPGFGLLFFGLRLRKKYKNYSAVLVTFALAFMYFVNLALFKSYHLMPQISALILMIAFSAALVVVALFYQKQVIAHIGLVLAYAVPFLMGGGAEQLEILFGYIAFVNIGILVAAFNKSWKSLYYSSFLLTWLQFLMWYVPNYRVGEHFELTFIFLYIFFSIFYVTFLIYKIGRRTRIETLDTLFVLANSFIFFGVGYATLSDHIVGEKLLGIFTISMAVVHLILGAIVYWQKLQEKVLLYTLSGLVVVFTTAAIPIQFSGYMVTILCAADAMVFFWIGRVGKVTIYEKLSYAVMLIATASLVHDWTTVYDTYYFASPDTRIIPLVNINFLTSMLFIIFFGVINIINFKIKFPSPTLEERSFLRIASFLMFIVFLSSFYYAFRIEIATFWDQIYTDSTMTLGPDGRPFPNYKLNTDLINYKTVWIFNYSLFFLSIVTFVNILLVKSARFASFNLILNALAIFLYLTQGLYLLSELGDSLFVHLHSGDYLKDLINSNVRYVSASLVAFLLVGSTIYMRESYIKTDFKPVFEVFFYTTILWIASSELVYWLKIVATLDSYKLALSSLWIGYSFFLITIGILKKKKHLRIAAIVLFAITLTKLIVYDISNLDSITIVIAFISIGILLLITSYLYSKKRV